MSFILDALKKSERERAPERKLFSGPAESDDPSPPYRRLVLIGIGVVLLLVLYVGINWWFGRVVTVATLDPEPLPTPVPTPLSPPSAAGYSPEPVSRKPRVHTLAAQVQSTTPKNNSTASESGRVTDTGVVTETGEVPVADEPVSIKFLRAMPPEFRRDLPDLTVNIHVYAPEESQRILYINNRQYHKGNKVADGIVVEEIVQDGAVLSRHGVMFKLERPK